jgi:Tol biopolymer transport system component
MGVRWCRIILDGCWAMVGQTITHYRITEKLGEGGMGVVYKADDLSLHRSVALKFLAPHALDDPDAKERFLREARAAASLDHPNVCTVYEIGEADGQTFLSMAFIEGRTVKEKIAERPLPLDEALDIALQAGEGLKAAHDKGIVHRDIKSANLMVATGGRVKVMDFGLAQLAGQGGLTHSHVTLGTVSYMSPEQAQRQPLDRRTDIWSLAVVLYEMVTGKRPFAGELDQAVIFSIIQEPHEPVTGIRAGLPMELDRILNKALAKRPEQRYQHVDDILVDLRALLGGIAKVQQASQWKRWVWAAALPLLLAAGFLGWRAMRAPQNTEPLRATALTTFPGMEMAPSLSPDGNHVVFSWTGPKKENQDIYVQQIGTGRPLQLTTDPLEDYNPVWSPDGKQIAFFRGPPPAPTGLRNRELRLIPPLGGPERKLAGIRSHDFVSALFLTWSADSRFVVVTDSPGEGKPDALFVVSVETGEKRRLTNPQAPVLSDMSPAISPDGRSLAFLRRTSWGSGELNLLPLGSGLTAAGEPVRLTPAELRADHPAWMPDGNEIVFSSKGSLWRVPVPGGGAPTRIPYVGEDGLMPAISAGQPGRPARLVYVRSFADFNFWRIETAAPGMPALSAPVVAAISSTKPEYHIVISPDGRRVAFGSSRSGDSEIWVSDLDGMNAVQLTSMRAQETMCPSWSPDGQSMLFSSNPEGEFDIYVVPVAGGKPRRLTSHPGIDICASYSADGHWIYFASMRSGDYRLWKMPASGGDAVQVTQTPSGRALMSPDGRDLFFNPVSIEAPVFRMPAAGGEPVKILDGMIWFNFHPLDKGAYYIDRAEGQTRLQHLNYATGKSTTVAPNLGEVSAGLTATPDGRTIFFTRMDASADDLMLVENFR